MSAMSKAMILGATTRPEEMVKIPESGDPEAYVIVRGMSCAERDSFEASLVEGKGRKRDVNLKNLRAKMVAICCVDDQRHPIFTESDVEALGEVRADMMSRIYNAAQRVCGFSDEDAAELSKP